MKIGNFKIQRLAQFEHLSLAHKSKIRKSRHYTFNYLSLNRQIIDYKLQENRQEFGSALMLGSGWFTEKDKVKKKPSL